MKLDKKSSKQKFKIKKFKIKAFHKNKKKRNLYKILYLFQTNRMKVQEI